MKKQGENRVFHKRHFRGIGKIGKTYDLKTCKGKGISMPSKWHTYAKYANPQKASQGIYESEKGIW